MTRYDHFLRLLVLACLVLAGLVATAAASVGLALGAGVPMQELVDGQGAALSFMTPAMTRLLLASQHVLLFILPALGTAWLFERHQYGRALSLDRIPHPRLFLAGVLFLLASLPLVNLSFHLNEMIPLPDWALSMESDARATLERILTMPDIWTLFANLVVIAILPGLGEELIFRGVIQKHLGGIMRSPAAGIWLTAVFFSAIHLQFEGFLPRLVLGLVLGYLFHWTRSLWIPVAVHAFNNGLQVVLLYATGMPIDEFDQQSTDALAWWTAPVGCLLMFLVYRQIRKSRPDGPSV